MRLTKHVYPSAILNFHALNRVSVKEQKLKPPHTPKASVGEGVRRCVVVAIGAPQEVGEVGPNAAALHTVAQRPDRPAWIGPAQIRAAGRIRQIRAAVQIRRPGIPVPTPLEHIPRHVV